MHVNEIAQPDSFVKELQQVSNLVKKLFFEDRHDLSDKNITLIYKAYKQIKNNKECIIVVTEKDAVKLKPLISKENLLADSIYFITLDLQFDNQDNFNQTILDYVRNN